MIRFLNVLAVIALIASASAAYSVKYETILVAEKLRKREAEIGKERDSIAVLQAEWQLLNRPSRLQLYARPEFGLQAITARQMGQAKDVPIVRIEDDKIDALLTGTLLPKASLPGKESPPKTGGQTPASPNMAARKTDGGTQSIATARPQTVRALEPNPKTAMTPRSAPLPIVQPGTGGEAGARTVEGPARNPLNLVPPAPIPTHPAPAKPPSGLSSLIGQVLGR
jgi:hypothetical protein